MKTIKIKLAFEPQISKAERKEKLENWAKIMLRKENINIVEINHYDKLSWIVVENSRSTQTVADYV